MQSLPRKPIMDAAHVLMTGTILASSVFPSVITGFLVGFDTIAEKMAPWAPWWVLLLFYLLMSCTAVAGVLLSVNTVGVVLFFLQIILQCLWPMTIILWDSPMAALAIAIASTLASGVCLSIAIASGGADTSHRVPAIAALSINFVCNIVLAFISYTNL